MGTPCVFCQFPTDKMYSSLTELVNQPGYTSAREKVRSRYRHRRKKMNFRTSIRRLILGALAVASFLMAGGVTPSSAQNTKPNIVMLMTDDTGWNDFGAYSLGGATNGHPTPNVDRMAKEGAVFTSWYGQASCTAGRASFITGRIPIRSALSIVVAPGDETTSRRRPRPSLSFSRRTATPRTSRESGIWATSQSPTRSSMALTR
jgi:hypothetical protein